MCGGASGVSGREAKIRGILRLPPKRVRRKRAGASTQPSPRPRDMSTVRGDPVPNAPLPFNHELPLSAPISSGQTGPADSLFDIFTEAYHFNQFNVESIQHALPRPSLSISSGRTGPTDSLFDMYTEAYHSNLQSPPPRPKDASAVQEDPTPNAPLPEMSLSAPVNSSLSNPADSLFDMYTEGYRFNQFSVHE